MKKLQTIRMEMESFKRLDLNVKALKFMNLITKLDEEYGLKVTEEGERENDAYIITNEKDRGFSSGFNFDGLDVQMWDCSYETILEVTMDGEDSEFVSEINDFIDVWVYENDESDCEDDNDE